jgi:predicted phosphodiesterase
MNQEPVAVLADIHGNVLALEAVLADMADQGIRDYVNLGDMFHGPLYPGPTADLLASHPPLAAVMGNQDRSLLEEGRPMDATTAGVLSEVEVMQLAWLTTLALTTTILDNQVFCCHGRPESDTAYLLEDVSSGRPELRPEGSVAADLATVEARVVVCGHSHLPSNVTVEGRLVINPGSVGLPAYAGEAADGVPAHAMSTGSPHARYAVISCENGVWSAEHRMVVYDWATASSRARSKGRCDWAAWLATGRLPA